MLKLAIRSFLVSMLIMTTVFADEENSNFLQQGDIEYPEPSSQSSYFATLAPIPSQTLGYMGVSVGVGMTTVKPTLEKESKVILTQDDGERNVLNYGGVLFGGLGTNFDKFYLGGEVSIGLNTMDKDISAADNIKLTVSQPLELGIDIIPGYLAQSGKIMLYGRLGIGSSWLKLGIQDPAADVRLNDKVSRMNFGVRLGIGTEFFMNELFSIRTEYLFTQYNGVDNMVKRFGNNFDGKLGASTVHRFNLGVLLRF